MILSFYGEPVVKQYLAHFHHFRVEFSLGNQEQPYIQLPRKKNLSILCMNICLFSGQ